MLTTRWQDYKAKLPDKTVENHYHGTKLTCSFSGQLCSDKDCGVCGIASEGFDRRCIRKKIHFQRFGHGFYLAPNSSKCHDYTIGIYGYRAMIMFDVLPGYKCKLRKTNEKFTLPRGYHSAYGETGEDLNYPELVIYNPDAALPKCIIIYQKDGDKRIAS